MSTGELQFRTATFGGFHKKDVMTYIETSSHSYNEKLDKLKKELEVSEKSRQKLEESLSVAKSRGSELERENNRLSGELSDKALALEATRDELGPKSQRLTELENLAVQLQERLAKAEPAAQTYESLKDLTAGIELEARQRAQMVEQDARQRADALSLEAKLRAEVTEQTALTKAEEIEQSALREAEIVEQNAIERAHAAQAESEARMEGLRVELEQWLGRVQAEYNRLRGDVDAAVSRTSVELEQMQNCLSSLTGQFSGHDREFNALFRACRDGEDTAGTAACPCTETADDCEETAPDQNESCTASAELCATEI